MCLDIKHTIKRLCLLSATVFLLLLFLSVVGSWKYKDKTFAKAHVINLELYRAPRNDKAKGLDDKSELQQLQEKTFRLRNARITKRYRRLARHARKRRLRRSEGQTREPRLRRASHWKALLSWMSSPVQTLPEDKPFYVVWNSPSFRCGRRFGLTMDLHKFGILNNEFELFHGEVVNLFYESRLGLYPRYLANGQPKFGGIPQLTNLTAHLEWVREDIEWYIPNVTYNGLAVIDWESWRPLFTRNWGSKSMYKSLSVDLVAKEHPTWPPDRVIREAEHGFEKAARALMEQTLALCRELRPRAKWGFYLFPDCYNYMPGQDSCSATVTERNDRLFWLYGLSSALYPSIYMSEIYIGKEQRQHVRGILKEAYRVRAGVHSPDVPVIPYARYVYVNSEKFLSKASLERTIGEAANSGAAGVVLWDTYLNTQTEEQCRQLHGYVHTVLGPYIIDLVTRTEACSESLCGGRGRCVSAAYQDKGDHSGGKVIIQKGPVIEKVKISKLDKKQQPRKNAVQLDTEGKSGVKSDSRTTVYTNTNSAQTTTEKHLTNDYVTKTQRLKTSTGIDNTLYSNPDKVSRTSELPLTKTSPIGTDTIGPTESVYDDHIIKTLTTKLPSTGTHRDLLQEATVLENKKHSSAAENKANTSPPSSKLTEHTSTRIPVARPTSLKHESAITTLYPRGETRRPPAVGRTEIETAYLNVTPMRTTGHVTKDRNRHSKFSKTPNDRQPGPTYNINVSVRPNMSYSAHISSHTPGSITTTTGPTATESRGSTRKANIASNQGQHKEFNGCIQSNKTKCKNVSADATKSVTSLQTNAFVTIGFTTVMQRKTNPMGSRTHIVIIDESQRQENETFTPTLTNTTPSVSPESNVVEQNTPSPGPTFVDVSSTEADSGDGYGSTVPNVFKEKSTVGIAANSPGLPKDKILSESTFLHDLIQVFFIVLVNIFRLFGGLPPEDSNFPPVRMEKSVDLSDTVDVHGQSIGSDKMYRLDDSRAANRGSLLSADSDTLKTRSINKRSADHPLSKHVRLGDTRTLNLPTGNTNKMSIKIQSSRTPRVKSKAHLNRSESNGPPPKSKQKPLRHSSTKKNVFSESADKTPSYLYDGYVCRCYPGWTGQFCDTPVPAVGG